jgi:hypothetical protein
MTAQEKQIITESVEWVNSKLPEAYQMTCVWYDCQYNGHTVKLMSVSGNELTVRTEYASTYAYLDGYSKAVRLVTACEAPEAPYSPELVEA